jgi:hypothetical protein
MQCPVCRAANDQGPQCRRCRADLTLLFGLEGQRRQLLNMVRQELVRGGGGTALEYARRVDGLRCDKESRRVLAVCHLLQRNFGEAWRLYQKNVDTV